PNLPGYVPPPLTYGYDPDKARQLLEQAGVPRNVRIDMWIRADQVLMMMAQSIQQDLALVGIQLKLKPLAWGPLLEAVRQPRTVPLFTLAWEADFPDPQNFLDVLLSKKQWGSNNDSYYSNPQVEE